MEAMLAGDAGGEEEEEEEEEAEEPAEDADFASSLAPGAGGHPLRGGGLSASTWSTPCRGGDTGIESPQSL